MRKDRESKEGSVPLSQGVPGRGEYPVLVTNVTGRETLCHPGSPVLSNSNRPDDWNFFIFYSPFSCSFYYLAFLLNKSLQWCLIIRDQSHFLTFEFSNPLRTFCLSACSSMWLQLPRDWLAGWLHWVICDLPDNNIGVIPAKCLPHISTIKNTSIWWLGFAYTRSSQGLVPTQASSLSITSGNFLEMQIHRPGPSTELETQRTTCFFTSPLCDSDACPSLRPVA